MRHFRHSFRADPAARVAPAGRRPDRAGIAFCAVVALVSLRAGTIRYQERKDQTESQISHRKSRLGNRSLTSASARWFRGPCRRRSLLSN